MTRINHESGTPMGSYQVWHREGGEFKQVGSLKVANLQAAAEVAMKRSPTWMKGEDTRKTRTGDVIVSPEGEAFKLRETLYGFTFEAVDFNQLRQDARESAEFREELKDAIKTALTSGASFRQIMQEAAAYGVKPEEVESVHREIEEGRER
jgi:hypothetical protein